MKTTIPSHTYQFGPARVVLVSVTDRDWGWLDLYCRICTQMQDHGQSRTNRHGWCYLRRCSQFYTKVQVAERKWNPKAFAGSSVIIWVRLLFGFQNGLWPRSRREHTKMSKYVIVGFFSAPLTTSKSYGGAEEGIASIISGGKGSI